MMLYFFQAEDGIRDGHVTGVQTCALPISTNKTKSTGMRLDERDDLLKEKLSSYRKTAVAEGAGTGAGGIFLGLAEIGRASCREREEISAIDGGIINKENK